MAHALKSRALGNHQINRARVLDLAIAITANFGIWSLILSAPGVLRQLI